VLADRWPVWVIAALWALLQGSLVHRNTGTEANQLFSGKTRQLCSRPAIRQSMACLWCGVGSLLTSPRCRLMLCRTQSRRLHQRRRRQRRRRLLCPGAQLEGEAAGPSLADVPRCSWQSAIPSWHFSAWHGIRGTPANPRPRIWESALRPSCWALHQQAFRHATALFGHTLDCCQAEHACHSWLAALPLPLRSSVCCASASRLLSVALQRHHWGRSV